MEHLSEIEIAERPQLTEISDACKRLFGTDEGKYRQRLLRQARLEQIRSTKIGKLVYLVTADVDRLAQGK